jgi:hypothetical protein
MAESPQRLDYESPARQKKLWYDSRWFALALAATAIGVAFVAPLWVLAKWFGCLASPILPGGGRP